MTKFNLYLAKGQTDKLKAESARTGLSVAELIRRAIDMAMKAEPREKGKN